MSTNGGQVKIKEFTDLGVKGALQLDFYNDRLMNAWFFPSDSLKYRSLFEKNRGIQLSKEMEIKIKPGTIVKEGYGSRRRYYVGWLDAALNKEINSQVD